MLFAGGAGSKPLLADHSLTGLHRIIVGGCGGVSALPARCWTLCQPGILYITPSSPETEIPLEFTFQRKIENPPVTHRYSLSKCS